MNIKFKDPKTMIIAGVTGATVGTAGEALRQTVVAKKAGKPVELDGKKLAVGAGIGVAAGLGLGGMSFTESGKSAVNLLGEGLRSLPLPFRGRDPISGQVPTFVKLGDIKLPDDHLLKGLVDKLPNDVPLSGGELMEKINQHVLALDKAGRKAFAEKFMAPGKFAILNNMDFSAKAAETFLREASASATESLMKTFAPVKDLLAEVRVTIPEKLPAILNDNPLVGFLRGLKSGDGMLGSELFEKVHQHVLSLDAAGRRLFADGTMGLGDKAEKILGNVDWASQQGANILRDCSRQATHMLTDVLKPASNAA